MSKFIIQPSGGGLGAKKIALVDLGGDTYVAGGIDLGLKYRILGVFCNQYLVEVDSGKVKLSTAIGTEATGTLAAGTQVFLILGI